MEHSLKFNYARKFWILKFKENGFWKQKWLPKAIGLNDKIEAEEYVKRYLEGDENPFVVRSVRTIRTLAPHWLALRRSDSGKINTYRGLKNSLEHHILNSSLADLDMEKELTFSLIRDWALKFQCAYNSRLNHISCLSLFIRDCINEEWIDPNLDNPCKKEPIKKLIKEISKARSEASVITYLDEESVRILLTKSHSKIRDIRRIKYLLALATGMRDMEISGLVFGDLSFGEIPAINVERQLVESGKIPYEKYEDLIGSGISKTEIRNYPNSVMSNPKYNSKRLIPMHPLLVSALKYWREVGWKELIGFSPTDNHPVFPRDIIGLKNDQTIGSFCKSDSAELIREDLERLDLPTEMEGKQINFHSLRHTTATLLDLHGVDADKIGVLLGHSSKTVTRKNYIAKNIETFKRVVNQIPLANYLRLQKVSLVAERLPNE